MAVWSLTVCPAFEQTLLFLDMLWCVYFLSWEFLFHVYRGLTLMCFLCLTSEILSMEGEMWAYVYIATSRHTCHIGSYNCCSWPNFITQWALSSVSLYRRIHFLLHAFYLEYSRCTSECSLSQGPPKTCFASLAGPICNHHMSPTFVSSHGKLCRSSEMPTFYAMMSPLTEWPSKHLMGLVPSGFQLCFPPGQPMQSMSLCAQGKCRAFSKVI